MNIGNQFKAARMRAGLTQAEASRKMGISRQTLSNWENERTSADVQQLLLMSHVYNTDVDSLLKVTQNIAPAPIEASAQLPKKLQIVRRALPLVLYCLAVIILCILTWCTETHLLRGEYSPGYWTVLWIFSLLPIASILTTLWVTADAVWSRARWCVVVVIQLLQMAVQYAWTYFASMVHSETAGREIDRISIFTETAVIALISLTLGVVIGQIIRYNMPKVMNWLKGQG